ncbi:unnamed protein product, partial [Phaeothamnion confervicola]
LQAKAKVGYYLGLTGNSRTYTVLLKETGAVVEAAFGSCTFNDFGPPYDGADSGELLLSFPAAPAAVPSPPAVSVPPSADVKSDRSRGFEPSGSSHLESGSDSDEPVELLGGEVVADSDDADVPYRPLYVPAGLEICEFYRPEMMGADLKGHKIAFKFDDGKWDVGTCVKYCPNEKKGRVYDVQ